MKPPNGVQAHTNVPYQTQKMSPKRGSMLRTNGKGATKVQYLFWEILLKLTVRLYLRSLTICASWFAYRFVRGGPAAVIRLGFRPGGLT